MNLNLDRIGPADHADLRTLVLARGGSMRQEMPRAEGLEVGTFLQVSLGPDFEVLVIKQVWKLGAVRSASVRLWRWVAPPV